MMRHGRSRRRWVFGPRTIPPVTQFTLSALLATLLIGVIAVVVLRQLGTREAIRDAKTVTRLAGEGIVEPNLTPGVLAGDPAALRRLDRIVRRRVRGDGIVRVKVWAADGRLVYSDEPRLIGKRFPLGAAERAVLRDGGVEADVSHLPRPENLFERNSDELLEVYLAINGPGGHRLLFEAYQRSESVSASARRLGLAFAPALLGGLLLLQLVNLPLARSLVRRLQDGQREREALLQRALDASQTERRRIAADLHDGVVQDLVGVSYALSAHAAKVDGANPAASTALVAAADQTRHSVRALRTLLVDIYPPSLHRSGLAAALADLARTATTRGLPTTLHASHDLNLRDDAEQLLFRCAQEALRNAHRHADARSAVVELCVAGGRAVMTVSDDGRGFDPAALDVRPAEGHFGLAVLRALVHEPGGTLDVHSAPGVGTTVRVEVGVA
jgi:two-component system NarL family sensor kinase